MGAYGVAILARQQYESNLDMEYYSTIAKDEDIDKLEIKVSHARCNRCENHCLLQLIHLIMDIDIYLETVVKKVLE